MRLYEFEKGRIGQFATQRNQNTFDFKPGEVADWPGWIKHPKHGVLGFAAKDGNPIPTAVQGWLNSLGYDVAQDGVFGSQTADAMNDAIEKIRSGEIALPSQNKPSKGFKLGNMDGTKQQPSKSKGFVQGNMDGRKQDYRTQPYGMKN